MKTEVYTINKGVNRAVEFRGLKAQWIWWLAGGVLSLLGGFAVLYIAGVNPLVCIGLVFLAGVGLFWQVYRLSRVYGRYGLMKRGAARRVPRRLKADSRRVYLKK